MTAKATVRVDTVRCPLCSHEMLSGGVDAARCTNAECDNFEKIFTIEAPSIEVNLREP
jgi:hypothetical protein